MRELDRRTGPDAGIADANELLGVLPARGADVEVQVGELQARPVSQLLGIEPLARDRGGDAAVAGHQLEALPVQRLG